MDEELDDGLRCEGVCSLLAGSERSSVVQLAAGGRVNPPATKPQPQRAIFRLPKDDETRFRHDDTAPLLRPWCPNMSPAAERAGQNIPFGTYCPDLSPDLRRRRLHRSPTSTRVRIHRGGRRGPAMGVQ